MNFVGYLLGKASDYLSGFTFKFWLALLAAVAVCIPLAYCKGVSDGKAIERSAWEKSARKAVERAREADETANQSRQDDTERNTENANRRDEAARSGGRDAANCERLRQAGIDTPPACD